MAGSEPSSSWRRHPDLNRGYAVLQTAALPLGYAAIKFNRTQIYADHRRYKKDAMRIALSAKRLSVYIRVQKGISYTMKLERETGFEPATSTLARLHSTAELFPLVFFLKHRYFKKLLLSLSRIKQNKTGYSLLPVAYWLLVFF